MKIFNEINFTNLYRFNFFFFTVLFFLLTTSSNAQLGFCGGNSGGGIFMEDFGIGSGSTSLPPGTTTYTYSAGFPNDGFYTVRNGSFGNGYDWHGIQDHTPNDNNGRFLIVNAGFVPGEFYKTTITGLCEFTTYEFSAWLINLLKVPGFCVDLGIEIPINVSFQIWDSNESTLLASGNTGDIFATAAPTWGQFGLVFQTIENQNSVVLKMLNNGVGGCGNDLAIDDIEFKSCGDTVIVRDENNEASISICESETPYSTTLTATPDFSVFTTHFYQWQKSSDGNVWQNIAGETSQSIDVLLSSNGFFRTKVAEYIGNLENDQCVFFSDEFQVFVNPNPPAPTSIGDVIFDCVLGQATLSVTSIDNTSVSWYGVAFGGVPLETNSLTFVATNTNTYYAEAIDLLTGCISTTRTAVSAINDTPPPFATSPQYFCGSVMLENIQIEGMNIQYYADASASLALDISEVIYENTLIYATQTIDDCESLELLEISIIIENCEVFIPQAISPNNDGFNDFFDIQNLYDIHENHTLKIFNRYGNCIFEGNNFTKWQGQSKQGKLVPVGTYFYVLELNNDNRDVFTGWVYCNY